MNRSVAAILLGTGAGVAAFAAAMIARRRSIGDVFKGRTVVITGGSRGLGLAVARELHPLGARLVLAARDQDELDEARRRLLAAGSVSSESDVYTVACDLTDSDEAKRLIGAATHHFGQVDVLINNAGIIHVGPLEEQSLDMYRDAMASNFFSMLYTTYAVLPQMLARREGAIANIASIGGKIPVPHLAPYTASKFAAVGFSETLHAELRSKGIQVTTINPGLMRTGSYPNAIVTGRKAEEYRWFRLSASLPGLAHSASGAARSIVRAIAEGRAEVEIGLDAYLAARLHGVLPTATQFAGSLAERVILPSAGGSRREKKGTNIKAPEGLWKSWSRVLTARFNQPEA